MKGNLEDLQMQALQNRPDLRAAVQGVTAANSGYRAGEGGRKTGPDRSGELHPSMAASMTVSFFASIPLPFLTAIRAKSRGRNSVITQMQEQQAFTNGQVLTDVKDAYEGLKSNERVVLLVPEQVPGHRQEVAGHQPITPTTAAASPCSISWTRNAAIALRNSATARRWLRTCLLSSNFAKPWASGTCHDPAALLGETRSKSGRHRFQVLGNQREEPNP